MDLWIKEKFVKKAREVNYLDFIVYSIEEAEVAYRNDSLEENTIKNTIYALRAFNRGVWSIKSTQNLRMLNKILDYVILEAKKLSAKTKPREWYKIEKPVKGKFHIGDCKKFSQSLAKELAETLGDRIKDKGCEESEVIITCSSTLKEYVSSEEANAVENKYTTEIALYAVAYGYRRGVAGEIIGFSGVINDISEKILFNITDSAVRRAKNIAYAKQLHPLRRGLKWDVVFDHVTSGAIFHELVHLLEADIAPLRIKIPSRITTANLTIIDDPTIPWGYGSYAFDDEGVYAKRTTLIEGGEIVSLIHTRLTSKAWGVKPTGNARGIFHKPKALMSNIVVKPSDWTLQELIEETKEGIYVEGLVKADISSEGIITLVPEACWIIERGELKEAVMVNYIKLQIPKHLNMIEGVGKELKQRISIEKGHKVSEFSPPIKIKSVIVG